MATRHREEKCAGERVTIRSLRLSDAGNLYRHIRDKAVVRWTVSIPHPYPEGAAEKFIRQAQRRRRAGRGFDFGIILRATGELIGGIGFKRVDQKHRCAELGYWMGKKYWGHGMATEAARLALAFGFRELKLYRIYACAFEENAGSCRVLEKCGFTREGVLREVMIVRGKRRNFVNYGILRPEYKGL